MVASRFIGAHTVNFSSVQASDTSEIRMKRSNILRRHLDRWKGTDRTEALIVCLFCFNEFWYKQPRRIVVQMMNIPNIRIPLFPVCGHAGKSFPRGWAGPQSNERIDLHTARREYNSVYSDRWSSAFSVGKPRYSDAPQ